MVKLTNTFSKLQNIKTLVIGDFMLDRYTYGNVNRISPEAPVSILKVRNEEMKLGGAGNVVLNLLSLGASVIAIGRIGDDNAGDTVIKLLNDHGCISNNLFIQKNYQTPVKNRLIAESQQVLRVDFEKEEPLSTILENKIIKKLPKLIKSVKVIAISDYAKGFLSDKLIRFVIDIARENKVCVIVDPKGLDFNKYKSANIIKPNLKEAYSAVNLSLDADLNIVAQKILDQTKIDNLLITRSSDGISLFSKDLKRQDFPVRSKEVKDVTGAGDTVLAMLCIALGNGLDLPVASQLANIAASIAIEHIGCAQITLADFAKRLLEYDTENKIFDFSHLFALKKALENKRFNLLGINSTSGMTSAILRAIKKLSKTKNDTIIYVLDENPDDEFADLLSSVNEVSFIILHNKSLKNLFTEILPEKVFILKKDVLNELKNSKELIKLC
ncbi:MAG: Bifunctional protein HldE, partial [Candidatus Anoxychlamydiales bacterium]|nr:Bifunctional protein HldE [Candidatus Anoxychlamydiales bacterium]NGX36803.1 Bifunctional protein HldE [Candidatus Anoxychlamydiales bacterium]